MTVLDKPAKLVCHAHSIILVQHANSRNCFNEIFKAGGM